MPQSRYRSLSGALVDLEKRRSSNEYDGETAASSSWSSRDTSGSYLPMLGGKPKAGPSIAYQLPRRRFARWFTLSIVAILVTFSLYLVHASLTNAAGFRVGQKRPLPPPAYEQFPFLKRYHGGVRALVDRAENKVEYPAASEEIEVQRLQEAALEQKAKEDKATSKDKGFQKREAEFVSRAQRFNPLPDYASEAYTDEYEAPKHCYLDSQKVDVPQLLGYKGIPQGFPDPVMGSYELLGLRNDVCFERYGRLSPYGYGYSQKFGGSGAGLDGEREGSEKVWDGQLEIDYGKVDWGQAQERCTEANKHRFKPAPRHLNHFFQSAGVGGPAADSSAEGKSTTDSGKSPAGKKLLPRTAVIIRTWWDYQYGIEELFYLRALINELSLQSSGEYTVHFLVHVKDDNKQIWSDDETYQKVLNDSLPAEFRGMGTLWSERQMGLIYGGVDESMYRNLPVHGVYRSTYMPVQYFAHMHPEYDFFWHWEMDARYTGHFYELFSKVGAWAKEQPRKGLWERNGRFYVPSEHGSWDDFRQMVRVQTDHGTAHQQNIYQKMGGDAAAKHPLDTASRRPEPPIWGPLRPSGGGDQTADPDRDPQPPTTFDQDNYAWGVGEDADFITFNPLFDPHGTNWILAEDVTGYNTSAGFPPRRTAIVTASRLSRRLLETMHRETALQRHTMFTEMWPGSCALHHGLKAVYAPHPVYIDRAWPTSYLAAIFNNGRNGASGGARTSVFSDERQINFKGTTWYYNSGFAPNLWKRWLGYKVDNDGGEQQELANEGRMCLPPMLLHPIKHFEMVYEHKADK